MKTKYEIENIEEMNKNPKNWKGIIYFNHKDSRLIVPKINPNLGWTLNFGNPFSYILLIGMISIIVAVTYFL